MSNNFRVDPDRIATEEEKRIQVNTYAVYRIENGLKLFEEDISINDSEDMKRKYRLLRAKFIDGKPKMIGEMAEAEKISERQAYRDINAAVDLLAIYIYGAVEE